MQPKNWVKEKEKKKIRSRKLYLHIVIHAVLLLLILEFDTTYLLGILCIVCSHFLIDIAKLYFQQKKNKRAWFFIDQLLHLLMLFIVVVFYNSINFSFIETYEAQLLLLSISLLLITSVSAVVIKLIINQWNPESKNEHDDSLAKAGRFIGILERLFVFIFVITNHWEAIGFLIAAKSVFRFGDLTSSKDRKLTEYILIGTLLSFGLAILVGILYVHLLQI